MLLGVHFFTASSLSVSLSQSYFSGLIIGIISHHLLDRLPHIDSNILNKKYKKIKDFDVQYIFLVIGEMMIFLILSFLFIDKMPPSLKNLAIIGGIGGVLPDLIKFFDSFLCKNKISYKIKILALYHKFHKNFHYQEKKINKPLAVLIEILLIALSVFLFKSVSI